jgi:acylphosphatase
VVRGFVQGVGYRDYASREAQRLGLHGYVRNASDGSVELEAEGERSRLVELLDELRRGPSFAQVDDVEAVWDTDQGEFKDWRLHW